MIMGNDPLILSVHKAQKLAQSIAGSDSGDALNHVNASTAFTLYLDSCHPAFDGLFDSIRFLPASHGADISYDVLLRFSAAALVGKENIVDSHGLVSALLGQGYEVSSQEYRVEYLYEKWQENPLSLCCDYFSCFLFGQYVQRLSTHPTASIRESDKNAVLHQMLGFVPQLWNAYASGQVSDMRFVSLLMLVASTVSGLGDDKKGELLLNQAIGTLQELKLPDLSSLINREFDNICFIGLNTFYLKDHCRDVADGLAERFIKPCLYESQSPTDPDYMSPRNLALRLFGIRCVLSDDEAEEIAKEFCAGCEFSSIMQIRQFLKSAMSYRIRLRKKLEDNGFSFDEVSPKSIHDYVQKIKVRESKFVKHPLDTVEQNEGDCKAVAALVALISLEAGMDASICIYHGQDVSFSQPNHLYIECKDTATGSRIPIDIKSQYGKVNDCVSDSRIVTPYPIASLIDLRQSEIVADLSAHRPRIRKLCQTGL